MDLPRASGNSYLQILTSAGDSAYYRPMVLLIWKALFDLLGHHDPVVLHSLSLGLHAMNGFLVYLLGSRFGGRAVGAASLILFASFPFSYQAVSHINSFFHLVVTACTLGALLLYANGRNGSSRLWLTFALILGAIGCFTHEYGVVVAAAIVLFEVREVVVGRDARVIWPAAFLALVGVYGVIWWLTPRWQATRSFDWPNIQVNAAYLGQGLLFPFVGWLPDLARIVPAGSDVIVAVSVGMFVLLGVLLIRGAGRATLFLTTVLWFLGAVLPAALLLSYHNYLVDAPRLMYFASSPAALAWALVASAPLAVSMRWRPAGWVVCGLLVAGLSWPGAAFVLEKSALMSLGGQVSESLATALRIHPDQRLLVVNFPAWLAPQREEHLLGHTGFSILPDYIGMERLAYLMSGQPSKLISGSFPSLRTRVSYNAGLHGQPLNIEELSREAQSAGEVYLAEYEDRSIRLRWIGGKDLLRNTASPLATFGEWASLETAGGRREGNTLALDLVWRPLTAAPADYTLFVHLYRPDGQPVTQADGYPLAGMLPPRLWQPGEPLLDRRQLKLAGDLEPGTYTLAVGWYDRGNGLRAAAITPSGERWRDDVVVVGKVTIP
jgi:hypothetical protein